MYQEATSPTKRLSIMEDRLNPSYNLSRASLPSNADNSSVFRQAPITLSSLQQMPSVDSGSSGTHDRIIPVEHDSNRSMNGSHLELVRPDSQLSNSSKKYSRYQNNSSSDRYADNNPNKQFSTLNDINNKPSTDINNFIVNSTATTIRPALTPIELVQASNTNTANSNINNNKLTVTIPSLQNTRKNETTFNTNLDSEFNNNKVGSQNSAQSPTKQANSSSNASNKKSNTFASITCNIL